MEALERYYMNYLSSYNSASNYSDYNVEYQLMVDRIEQILDKEYVDSDDVEFIRSILPEIENEGIRNEIEEYLEGIGWT